MKSMFAAAFIVMPGFAAVPANAQAVDMSTVTCADFSGRPADQKANIMFWLAGYYTQENKAATVNFADLKSTLDKILLDCSKNPAAPLLTVAGAVMGH